MGEGSWLPSHLYSSQNSQRLRINIGPCPSVSVVTQLTKEKKDVDMQCSARQFVAGAKQMQNFAQHLHNETNYRITRKQLATSEQTRANK